MDDRALTTQKQQPSGGSLEQTIAALIARMMLHFWTPQELSDGARKAMAADWVADLREFGPDTLSRACGEWRRTQTKRPTIADIRKLCFEFRQMHQPHHAIVDGRSDPHEAADRYARSAGWASELERQDAIDARKRAFREAEYWRANNPQAVAAGFQTPAQLAKALGVTAREWTSEEMAEGRKQVGLE